MTRAVAKRNGKKENSSVVSRPIWAPSIPHKPCAASFWGLRVDYGRIDFDFLGTRCVRPSRQGIIAPVPRRSPSKRQATKTTPLAAGEGDMGTDCDDDEDEDDGEESDDEGPPSRGEKDDGDDAYVDQPG